MSLEQPAGITLDSVIKTLGLPAGFDYQGRIGMRFEYQLIHKKRELLRSRTLEAQGVRPGDVLALQVQVKQLAAASPIGGRDRVAVFRGEGMAKVPKEVTEEGWRELQKRVRRGY